jgi:hypothetical protein
MALSPQRQNVITQLEEYLTANPEAADKPIVGTGVDKLMTPRTILEHLKDDQSAFGNRLFARWNQLSQAVLSTPPQSMSIPHPLCQ